MKRAFIVLLCCYASVNILAQAENNQITIGVNHTIKSSVLDQDRTIQIYVPDSYNDSDQSYPVLYILDGQWFFENGIAIQKSLRTPRAIPEMIVVGIKNSNPLRNTLFGEESNKFTDFLKNEVIHFLDSNYRTNEERVIFGWQNAAFYISEIFLIEKDLFSGAIISAGGHASEEDVKEYSPAKNTYLYIANSKRDIYTISYSDALSEVLKKNSPENLRWKYELFNDEVHETIAHLALYKGIKYYYHNYDGLVFESIQSFADAGGITYLNSYFKERTIRFGKDVKIENKTKNGLIWLTLNRDNFEYFSLFMKEFKDVLSTERYASAYWQNRFGQFYLKHKDYHNAHKYFNAGLTLYPDTNLETEMAQGLSTANSMLK